MLSLYVKAMICSQGFLKGVQLGGSWVTTPV